jgi:hypothetical protein
LYIWWARRWLAIRCAAILGSMLPQWSADWLNQLRQKFPTEEVYFNWFIRLEADVLDRMRLTFYADELTVPPE